MSARTSEKKPISYMMERSIPRASPSRAESHVQTTNPRRSAPKYEGKGSPKISKRTGCIEAQRGGTGSAGSALCSALLEFVSSDSAGASGDGLPDSPTLALAASLASAWRAAAFFSREPSVKLSMSRKITPTEMATSAILNVGYSQYGAVLNAP